MFSILCQCIKHSLDIGRIFVGYDGWALYVMLHQVISIRDHQHLNRSICRCKLGMWWPRLYFSEGLMSMKCGNLNFMLAFDKMSFGNWDWRPTSVHLWFQLSVEYQAIQLIPHKLKPHIRNNDKTSNITFFCLHASRSRMVALL